MEFASYLDEVSRQATAMRAAVVAAGPAAEVPTCPEWTVQRLVRHLAKVHNWVIQACRTEPGGAEPHPERAPEDWDELLSWWDNQVDVMVGELRERGPGAPAWTFIDDPTTMFWARRQAHETAIHRLDAEHAAARSNLPTAVPSLVFDPTFAADGADEALVLMIPRRLRKEPADLAGTVLFHAADAGRAWLVTLRPGEPLEIGPAHEPAVDTDASVVGTADAVYRAVWHRPSNAVTGGDPALVAALRTP